MTQAERLTVRGLGGTYLFAYVYRDQAAMHRAAVRFNPDFTPDDCDACFQVACDRDGVERSFLGVVRYSLHHLSAEIVVHEMVHAAVESCRRAVGADRIAGLLLDEDVSTGVNDSPTIHGEEMLAHAIGQLSDQTLGLLAEAGYETTVVKGSS